MNIINSAAIVPAFGQRANANVNTNKPIAESARSADANKITPEQQEKKSTIPSRINNEQAFAQFQENQTSPSSLARPYVEQPSYDKLFATDQAKPSLKNETAVANYQSVSNLAQRESVQKIFGVDLFA